MFCCNLLWGYEYHPARVKFNAQNKFTDDSKKGEFLTKIHYTTTESTFD